MRIEKEDVINHKRYSYHVAGSVILGEKCINTTDNSTIYTNRYEYDGSGNVVVRYSYDSWGKPISMPASDAGSLYSTLGVRNPFRYRGYYYDAETNLYYVKSRYYEPEIGRWISADEDETISVQSNVNDKNLYAYCDNNPIDRRDEDGQFWITVGIMAAGGLIGGLISGTFSAVSQYHSSGSINWKSVAVDTVSGIASGALAASPVGLGGQIIGNAMISCISYAADCEVNGEKVDAGQYWCSAASGAVSGRIGGPGANQYNTLTNAVKVCGKTVDKYSTKQFEKYAVKRIVSARRYRNNKLVNAVRQGIKSYINGALGSFGATQLYNAIRK